MEQQPSLIKVQQGPKEATAAAGKEKWKALVALAAAVAAPRK